MIHHHPDNNMLLEYASGSLNWAHSIVVAAHLQLCPKCAADLKLLNGIGGNLLATSAPVPASAPDQEKQSFEQLMRRIDSDNQSSEPPEAPKERHRDPPCPANWQKIRCSHLFPRWSESCSGKTQHCTGVASPRG